MSPGELLFFVRWFCCVFGVSCAFAFCGFLGSLANTRPHPSELLAHSGVEVYADLLQNSAADKL